MKSTQELHDLFVTEFGAQAPEITDYNEGSNVDVAAGVTALAASEVLKTVVDKFRKTFFATSFGPEVTGGPDDLQTLALDHFGERFRRPESTRAIGVVTFSRPNAEAGSCEIPGGTIVKTAKSAGGTSVSFETIATVTLVGLTINASVRAVLTGPSGNVNPSTVTIIEDALTDPSVVVNNATSFTGGALAQNDAEYNVTIKNLLETLKGATIAAIEAKAKTVAGVVHCKAIEALQTVIEWDVAEQESIGGHFSLPRPKVYVADVNGDANQALLESVFNALQEVRAAGVRVEVLGAIPVEFDWSAELTLNPDGGNYATLQLSLALIKEEMTKYIQNSVVGASFNRVAANNYILSKFGPSGTNDLATFVTTVPTANVVFSENQKMVVGEILVNGN